MKKLLLIALLIFCLPSLAETQFSVGGGINMSILDVKDDLPDGVDEQFGASLAVAAKARIKISDYWSLRTGLWLQEKTWVLTFENATINGVVINDAEMRGNTIYTSIPLTAEYQMNKFIGLFAGYIADFRINDYCESEGDITGCYFLEDSRSVVHLMTIGITTWATKNFDIELSWQEALSDYIKNESKLDTLQLMVFYKFQ